MIKDNIKETLEIISQAEKRSIYHQHVDLIAVSKTKPAEMIRSAYDFGIRDFGENKAQELCMKYDLLPKDIRWHLIGHLQTNKVKQVIGKTFLIHSVDSLKLAEEIQKQAEKKNIICDILIQVNITEEETKSGTSTDEVINLVKKISMLSNIRIKGLMTIGPITNDADKIRECFKTLKNLSIDINRLNIDNVTMCFLSMGMSSDFQIAIEEGSNFVRVGTNIFGARDYSKTL